MLKAAMQHSAVSGRAIALRLPKRCQNKRLPRSASILGLARVQQRSGRSTEHR